MQKKIDTYFAKNLIIGQLGRRTVTKAKHDSTFHFKIYVFKPYILFSWRYNPHWGLYFTAL